MPEKPRKWISLYPGEGGWFYPHGPHGEKLFAQLWDSYTEILRSKGIAEIQAVLQYLRNQLDNFDKREERWHQEIEELKGTPVGTQEEWEMTTSLMGTYEGQREEDIIVRESLRLRVVTLENMLWHYCLSGETQNYDGGPILVPIDWKGKPDQLFALFRGLAEEDFVDERIPESVLLAHFHPRENQDPFRHAAPIQWRGDNTALLFLFMRLRSLRLVSERVKESLPLLLVQHFVNKKGEPLKSRHLSTQIGQIRDYTNRVNQADKIDKALSSVGLG